jgi:ferritin-like metal-binding protein YciE
MAQTETLHDAFLDELRDAYDAERQLIKALPKMAKAAESDELRTAFETHLEETQGHAERLEQVFASLEEKVRGKHCDGMAGIIEEGRSVMGEDFEGTTLDACLIAAAQRAEHYEMAAYGTLVSWAKAMGHQEAAGLLEEILEEEKATDEKLTQIAESGINQEAAQAAHGDGEEGMELAMAGASRSAVSGRSSGRATSSRNGSSRTNSSRGSSSRNSSSSRSRGGSKKR